MAIENRETKEKKYIKGELIHTIFLNRDEHFSIAKIKVLETNESLEENEIVVKGYFSSLDEGEIYLFNGRFEHHKRFGKQYHVEHYQRYIPETKDGLVSYLSSDLFYGIGKKTAQRIIHTLGENAIASILQDKDVLHKVPGLKKEKANRLYEDLKEHQGFEHIVIHLSNYGIGLKMAQKIYHFYKEETIRILQEEPYQYVFDIEGFGFQRADEMARINGIPMNHPSRIRAACIFVLQQSIQDGHVYLPIETCLYRIDALVHGQANAISPEAITQEMLELNKQKKVIMLDSCIYLPSLYYAETGFCTHLNRVIENKIEEQTTQAELMKIIGEIEEEESLSYGKEQFQAIEQALSAKIMVLTGGPGTGKTTVIKGIIKAFAHIHDLSLDQKDYKDNTDYPFILTAPTGRAAKRMTESTGLPAVTIHRLLGWNGKETFEKDEQNRLNGRLLVIDEFSMVDIWLANQLFKAIPDDMQVLIVGDEDQLPSVGPGQVLADLLAGNALPSVKLSEVYRQKEGSKIIQLAHAIKNNTCEESSLQKDHDFNFISCTEQQVVEVIVRIVEKAQKKGVDIRDIQVLAPMYKSAAGIHRINEEVQQLINPKTNQKRQIKWKDVFFRTGDKVIQLVNQPDDNVFNGDIGEIVAIYQEGENGNEEDQLVVAFDEKEVAYDKKDLGNLMHAFCTSIHKSQGSEFPIVLLPVVPGYRRMLKKNLLYTAVTRSKKSLILCGNKAAFLRGIKEEDKERRYTTLQKWLKVINLHSDAEEEEEVSPYDFL
ncbi:ATP-dependent RecD-like DNA helicase [Aquibacillus sp. 3ASR75-11]|uniref:ATP-dependent RecD2 DNA helicase n=1 Tax=Terrihalobacillus insolitus TaxID=2950438 RepID=A0A9X3WU45_9BACI|nr:ATP-dependent RecD-like DNA helicase [Terrihalobacillus insolitus]MDC3413290.1 ATP-dependent RecD-like DNA helicase [Terrihalobacillus insolitus]MDC3424873.1 ATP-dependent RecD-like DNA helicase [Terrihalobacillus insolitus]